MLTFIFLGILLPHVAMPAPLLTGLRQVALQGEVNILVYGVLQFSKSLHDLYDSTAQKLDRIRHNIGLYEQRLGVLHRQTQRAQKDQKEIRGVVEGLKAKNTVLWQQTWSNKKMLQKVLVGHQNLSQRMKGVEEMLASMEERGFPDKERGFPALKAHMHQQNLTIWSLLGATHQQQQQMARQKEQLLWIQEKARQEGQRAPWGRPLNGYQMRINRHEGSKMNAGGHKDVTEKLISER